MEKRAAFLDVMCEGNAALGALASKPGWPTRRQNHELEHLQAMKRTHTVPTMITVLCALLVLTRTAHTASPPDLIAAVRAGDTAKVKALLKSPGQAAVRDVRGNTALHWAALANDARLVARLLAAGGMRAPPTSPEQRHCITEPVTSRSSATCSGRARMRTPSPSSVRPRCIPPPPGRRRTGA